MYVYIYIGIILHIQQRDRETRRTDGHSPKKSTDDISILPHAVGARRHSWASVYLINTEDIHVRDVVQSSSLLVVRTTEEATERKCLQRVQVSTRPITRNQFFHMLLF